MLERNDASGGGKVEDEAVIVYSSLRDERGYSYLKFNFATNEHDPDLDEMVNIEFVAKRTETEGTRPLKATRATFGNVSEIRITILDTEKSKLGYPVWDDGTFEPEEMEDHVAGMSADDLNRQIQMPTLEWMAAGAVVQAPKTCQRSKDSKHRERGTARCTVRFVRGHGVRARQLASRIR